MGSEQAAVSLTCFYGPFRSLYIGGRISLQCSKIRGDGSRMDGWTMWPSLPLPLPAALFDAAELMEEAERLDGRTRQGRRS